MYASYSHILIAYLAFKTLSTVEVKGGGGGEGGRGGGEGGRGGGRGVMLPYIY